MKRRPIDAVDIHQTTVLTFHSSGDAILARIGFMPCFSMCFLNSLPICRPDERDGHRILLRDQRSALAWGRAICIFQPVHPLPTYCSRYLYSSNSPPARIILDASSMIIQTLRSDQPDSCQSICPADKLCSRSYRIHLRRPFFLGSSWARPAALIYM